MTPVLADVAGDHLADPALLWRRVLIAAIFLAVVLAVAHHAASNGEPRWLLAAAPFLYVAVQYSILVYTQVVHADDSFLIPSFHYGMMALGIFCFFLVRFAMSGGGGRVAD